MKMGFLMRGIVAQFDKKTFRVGISPTRKARHTLFKIIHYFVLVEK